MASCLMDQYDLPSHKPGPEQNMPHEQQTEVPSFLRRNETMGQRLAPGTDGQPHTTGYLAVLTGRQAKTEAEQHAHDLSHQVLNCFDTVLKNAVPLALMEDEKTNVLAWEKMMRESAHCQAEARIALHKLLNMALEKI